MALTLLFPDTLIADPAPLRHASVRSGQVKLRRARVVDRLTDAAALPSETLYEQWLRRELALPAPLSIEAGSAYADGTDGFDDTNGSDGADRADRGHWRLTPVHLHLGLDKIVLTDPTQLLIDQASAQGFADAIAQTLASADMRLTVGSPNRWYLTAPNDFQVTAYGWRVASGRRIDGFQPLGPSARRWRQLLTEIQMVWYEHPLNQQRAQRGLPVLNSLWLDGRAGAAQRFDYDVCCTDWASLQGLVASAAPRLSHQVSVIGLAQLGDALATRQQRTLVVFDPTVLADSTAAGGQALNDAVNTSERLGAHWRRVVTILSQPGVLPGWANILRSASQHALRAVLTGDRVAVALQLNPIDDLALLRQLPFASLFEAGERALLRDAG